MTGCIGRDVGWGMARCIARCVGWALGRSTTWTRAGYIGRCIAWCARRLISWAIGRSSGELARVPSVISVAASHTNISHIALAPPVSAVHHADTSSARVTPMAAIVACMERRCVRWRVSWGIRWCVCWRVSWGIGWCVSRCCRGSRGCTSRTVAGDIGRGLRRGLRRCVAWNMAG